MGDMFNKGPKPKRKLPVCGNYKCKASTDLTDSITHGWGKLDNNGFWEFSCPDPRHIEQDRELYEELSRLELRRLGLE